MIQRIESITTFPSNRPTEAGSSNLPSLAIVGQMFHGVDVVEDNSSARNGIFRADLSALY